MVAAPLAAGRPGANRGEAASARERIRRGLHDGQTAGLAPDAVQGNLAILPADLAGDFLRFCHANPKPCPLLAVSEPGDPRLPALGAGIDIRTDLPRYRVFRDGRTIDEPTDILAHWRDDLVSFVLGCSFSFEWSLLQAGVPLRHIERGTTVPMYRTAVDTVPAGPFRGKLVVSMRPLTAADAIRAIQITSRFPSVHGAPVHLGDPSHIGIADLDRPDYGDPIDIAPDEMPVFWACGVTPQAVIAETRPAFAITHKPGCMLITDLSNASLAVI